MSNLSLMRIFRAVVGSWVVGLALGAGAVPAYGAGASPLPQEASVDTLESGRIIVRNPLPRRGGGPDEWRLVEELRLGQVDGTGPEVFGDVHDVAVDERGNIYVLDVGSKEVRVFDRGGRFLRRIARGGEGPGEVRYWESLGQALVFQPPNRVWIGDGLQQLSFDSLGNELSRIGGFPLRGGRPWSRIVAADDQGFVYQQVRVMDVEQSGEETISRGFTYGVRLPVYPEHPNPVLPRDSVLLDSRSSTRTMQSRRESGGTISVGGIVKVSIPRRVWGFSRGETVWVANRAAYRFHEVAFAGDTIRTIELGDPPPPPPDDSDESEFEPLVANLDVSPEGWLWVLRFPDDPEDPDRRPTWDLFDNCGRYRGEVSAPARIATIRFGGEMVDPIDLGAGGVVHGVARDTLDLSYVLRLRLESEGGAPPTREACPY
ncbi:6-bladed beta-propeller [Candidatus Palauibacter sp.]|uniref:6-bladed beta-propeller n=1 Tax=Candidatus Palauibacter sp. TaxID=3101350 RepID=UPI003B51C355